MEGNPPPGNFKRNAAVSKSSRLQGNGKSRLHSHGLTNNKNNKSEPPTRPRVSATQDTKKPTNRKTPSGPARRRSKTPICAHIIEEDQSIIKAFLSSPRLPSSSPSQWKKNCKKWLANFDDCDRVILEQKYQRTKSRPPTGISHKAKDMEEDYAKRRRMSLYKRANTATGSTDGHKSLNTLNSTNTASDCQESASESEPPQHKRLDEKPPISKAPQQPQFPPNATNMLQDKLYTELQERFASISAEDLLCMKNATLPNFPACVVDDRETGRLTWTKSSLASSASACTLDMSPRNESLNNNIGSRNLPCTDQTGSGVQTLKSRRVRSACVLSSANEKKYDQGSGKRQEESLIKRSFRNAQGIYVGDTELQTKPKEKPKDSLQNSKKKAAQKPSLVKKSQVKVLKGASKSTSNLSKKTQSCSELTNSVDQHRTMNNKLKSTNHPNLRPCSSQGDGSSCIPGDSKLDKVQKKSPSRPTSTSKVKKPPTPTKAGFEQGDTIQVKPLPGPRDKISKTSWKDSGAHDFSINQKQLGQVGKSCKKPVHNKLENASMVHLMIDQMVCQYKKIPLPESSRRKWKKLNPKGLKLEQASPNHMAHASKQQGDKGKNKAEPSTLHHAAGINQLAVEPRGGGEPVFQSRGDGRSRHLQNICIDSQLAEYLAHADSPYLPSYLRQLKKSLARKYARQRKAADAKITETNEETKENIMMLPEDPVEEAEVPVEEACSKSRIKVHKTTMADDLEKLTKDACKDIMVNLSLLKDKRKHKP